MASRILPEGKNKDQKRTHFKGLMGELKFVIRLLDHGWQVYEPVDHNSRADLVIEKEGVFKKIQVKYCSLYKGCLRIELEHPHRNTGPYLKEDIDEIAVYNPEYDKYYLIPLERFGKSKELWFRIEEPKTEKGYKINWIKNYEI